MSGWMETFLAGTAMTAVFFGVALLVDRAIIKRIKAEHEQEQKRRHSFELEDDQC